MTLAHLMDNAVQEDRERINKLIQILIQNGRNEDLLKSTKDPYFQQQLLEKFNL